jgi:lysylphosphatidylglycerol synthetase-like protein (DUF2156 family)
MPFVIAAIVVVWIVIFGAAYLSRAVGGLSRRSSVAIVTCSYFALSTLALLWFGLNWAGFLGIFGMLMPYAAGTGVVMIASIDRRPE